MTSSLNADAAIERGPGFRTFEFASILRLQIDAVAYCVARPIGRRGGRVFAVQELGNVVGLHTTLHKPQYRFALTAGRKHHTHRPDVLVRRYAAGASARDGGLGSHFPLNLGLGLGLSDRNAVIHQGVELDVGVCFAQINFAIAVVTMADSGCQGWLELTPKLRACLFKIVGCAILYQVVCMRHRVSVSKGLLVG